MKQSLSFPFMKWLSLLALLFLLNSKGHAQLFTLVSPLSGDIFFEGDIFVMEVDPDNPSTARFEFFVDGISLGIDSVPPFRVEWVATGIGSHTFL